MKKKKMLKPGLLVGLLITTVIFMGGCIPGGEAPADGGFNPTIIIFLVLMFAFFYFVLIRPQRKKQKEQQHMVQELKRGDNVITIGGIYGQIDSLSEDSIVIKVESGVMLRLARSSIAGIKDKDKNRQF